MPSQKIDLLKKEIVSMGSLLWDKGLVGGWNGNLSVRIDAQSFLITARGTSLGRLQSDDVVVADIKGEGFSGKAPSSEKLLHQVIYQEFPLIKAIVHTHTVFTNAFFLEQDVFVAATFEGQHVLGDVFGVPQSGLNVTDMAPVIARLRANKLVVLQKHGVVSVGEDLFECFARVQTLEEQVKMEAMRKLFASNS